MCVDYVFQDQFDDVLNDCTSSIKIHPTYLKPILRRAQTYEKKEKFDEALEDYKKVLELDPKCQEAVLACQVTVIISKLPVWLCDHVLMYTVC